MIIQLRLNTASFSVGQREANDTLVTHNHRGFNSSTPVPANYGAHEAKHTHTSHRNAERRRFEAQV